MIAVGPLWSWKGLETGVCALQSGRYVHYMVGAYVTHQITRYPTPHPETRPCVELDSSPSFPPAVVVIQERVTGRHCAAWEKYPWISTQDSAVHPGLKTTRKSR